MSAGDSFAAELADSFSRIPVGQLRVGDRILIDAGGSAPEPAEVIDLRPARLGTSVAILTESDPEWIVAAIDAQVWTERAVTA